jgi:hypothetical protein
MAANFPDIRRRSYAYSLRAIKVYQALQQGKDGAGWVLGKQYLRAATSTSPINARNGTTLRRHHCDYRECEAGGNRIGAAFTLYTLPFTLYTLRPKSLRENAHKTR